MSLLSFFVDFIVHLDVHLGEMISMPVSSAYVANLAPAHLRGLYMGTYGLTWSVAFIFGPSLGMALFSVRSNVTEARVVASDLHKGTAVSVVSTARELPERSDQSAWPV